ncbi:TonB-dependent receptor [Chryseobacterium shigense]|uniref:Outer membrane receptor proteins, mostly Fe transport n=1 Tax=Chryseobacterium shigense TaxID=297244 RepID=A0A1N7HU08_9FLAO|nr:TonB-dependent receptor [Chryseobacterium shigense]PQA93148.1 TonB-dependent receptor [Chryseobacterium shigense]SIS28337.1 Outer membrane receptor proteins, mostly Fe transport [Chryseobacterium shigense]
MRKSTLTIAALGIALLCSNFAFAQKDSLSVQDSVRLQERMKSSSSKEDNNRNVMLNAANNTSPRDVNIGLPSTVGGITILENDLPVVYFFWPELPNKTWRQSVGLEKTGLLKMDQLANTMGDLGFAVNSYAQTGTKDFKLKGKLTTSTFGWLQGDVNASGPISKNGWTYTVGAFANYDPSTFKLGFARNVDETKIFRAGVTKYFNDDKGKISILYKYSDSYNVGNYAVFQYGENGKVTELDNFKIGRDSYVVNDGRIRMKDILSGENYWASMNGNDNRSKAHNIDVFGNYLLNNGWNFKFSARAHFATAKMSTIIPLSIFQADPSAGYTIASNGQPYSGAVGTQLAMHTPETPITNIAGRFSLNKQVGNHHLTVGLLEQFYNVDQFTSNRSFFFQTVEPQPQRLIGPTTDANGFYNYNAGGEYHSGTENKLSVYATDDWKVSDNFNVSYGLHLRNHLIDGEFSMTPRSPGFVFGANDFQSIKENWFQIGGSLNATYNISKNFGVIANLLYTEENRRLESYSQAFDPNTNKIKSPLGALGIFWNTDYIQLISQATYLKKNNNLNRYNLVNPDNTTQAQNVTVYYDIQTIGWTTDFVLKPFKGFNLHYLITLQNPVYKKFNFNAFGKEYDYNDNNVLGVAKVLMEIDPSYTIDKWRFWASFRYFSKQYANLTNALYFAPRWETFGGVNYTVNKNINVGATVINFLNQRGASGTINGAELITDASPYYGKLLTGTYIMPLTGQFSISFNF